MAGLPNNSNNQPVLTQWYQLFMKQNTQRSAQANMHWEHLTRIGLPNHKHEQWKYTPLDKLWNYNFAPATTKLLIGVTERNALSLQLDAYRLVFVDGRFIPELSDSPTGCWQINIEEGGRSVQNPIKSEFFLHLTESLSQQTTHIRLPAGKKADRPIYLLHISQGVEDKHTLSMLQYRHHINIEAETQGEVIEHFASLSNHAHFSGARTSMTIGHHASFHHIKLAFENCASYHFSHNDICISRDAVVRSNTVLLGAHLTKHHISAQLNGEGADLSLNSLMLPTEHNINDISIYLEHNKGHCVSRQLHKIIACNRGKGVFTGLIKVAKHALKTDGRMINNNLLLDSLAEINTRPQLEIYSDDVKCSHGATIGKINKEQLFYLRSRSIPHEEAKRIIIYAFAAEVIEAINYQVVQDIILSRLNKYLNKVTL